MKVGDYVRTHGYIDKIININDFRESSMKYALEQPSWNDDVVFIGEEDIIKSSPNIIDLIEVGDYVNGSQVVDIAQAPKKALYTEDIRQKGALIPIINNEIESIVTKEQFESMKYKVGE